MRKKRLLMIIAVSMVAMLVLAQCGKKQERVHEFKTGTIEFASLDSLLITADLYVVHEKTAPFILLCHRAAWSRGEYLEIAPKLNEMGFNCMAIDQRSGKEINGVVNETKARAKELGKGGFYISALPDIEAAVQYARDKWKTETIIIWGSSYSAALAFIIGYKYPDDIDGIVAFSPGEYLTLDEKIVEYYARQVKCPVFITSAKDEHHKWENIYTSIPSEVKSYFLPDSGGKHGSEALWERNEGYEGSWKALKKFLQIFL